MRLEELKRADYVSLTADHQTLPMNTIADWTPFATIPGTASHSYRYSHPSRDCETDDSMQNIALVPGVQRDGATKQTSTHCSKRSRSYEH